MKNNKYKSVASNVKLKHEVGNKKLNSNNDFQFYEGQYDPELRRKMQVRAEANKPVNTTSEFIFDDKTMTAKRNPNAKMGLEIVSPEFQLLTAGVGSLAGKSSTLIGKIGQTMLHGAGQGAMANMSNLSGSEQNLEGLATDVLGGAIVGGALKGGGIGAKSAKQNAYKIIQKQISNSSPELTKFQNIQYDIALAKNKIKNKVSETVQPIRNTIQDFKNQKEVNKLYPNLRKTYYNDFRNSYDSSLPGNDKQRLYQQILNKNIQTTKELSDAALNVVNPQLPSRYTERFNRPAFEMNTKSKNILSGSMPLNEKTFNLFSNLQEIKPYLGFSLHDNAPFNFRTSYKTVGELNNALRTGTYTPKPEYREEVARLIKEQESLYPNAKVSGSSKLFAEGKTNKFPQDIDLYTSELGTEKNVFLPNDRHATNIQTPQVQKQLEAYNNPDEYIRLNKEAFEKSKNTASVVNPEYNKYELEHFDPIKSSIMDAFMSNKPKHIERVDEMFNTLSVEELSNAVKTRRKILGHENLDIPKFKFDDIDDNKRILEKFNFIGNKEAMANSPEKMQLYFDNQYSHHMLGSRQLRPYQSLNSNEISLKDYALNDKGVGGRVYGEGIYIGQGIEGYGPLETIIPLKPKTPIQHPTDILKSHEQLLENYTNGNRRSIITIKDNSTIENPAYFVNDGSDRRFRPNGRYVIEAKKQPTMPLITKRKSNPQSNYVSTPKAHEKFAEYYKKKYFKDEIQSKAEYDRLYKIKNRQEKLKDKINYDRVYAQQQGYDYGQNVIDDVKKLDKKYSNIKHNTAAVTLSTPIVGAIGWGVNKIYQEAQEDVQKNKKWRAEHPVEAARQDSLKNVYYERRSKRLDKDKKSKKDIVKETSILNPLRYLEQNKNK